LVIKTRGGFGSLLLREKNLLTRRDFLRTSCALGAGALLFPSINLLPQISEAAADLKRRPKKGFILKKRKEAYYYKRLEKNMTECAMCHRRCVLNPGERSFCRNKENIKGKLYTFAYSNPCAVHIDPIEKKPFYHVLPGSGVFSIATAGCNFRCRYCQNWTISQRRPEDTYNYYFTPKDVVDWTLRYGCKVIAYTYTEPNAFFEYMLDTARLAKKKGILNTYHTNGFIRKEPLKELCKFLDAANIDLKGFTTQYYRYMSQAWVEPVLETLKILKENGVFVEITNLVVPTHNDDPKIIRKMCNWIAKELGTDTPVHFSRFHPMHLLKNLYPTPVKTLETAYKIAVDEGLKYVYIGNVLGHPAESTYCPNCRKVLIKRYGYMILTNRIKKGRCSFCSHRISGIWTQRT
jgi:pyruvate formate lyase activating enzyme